jgi:hypothetical protein
MPITSSKFQELFPNASEGTFLFSATRARRRYDNTAYGQYYRFSSTDDATSETIFLLIDLT